MMAGAMVLNAALPSSVVAAGALDEAVLASKILRKINQDQAARMAAAILMSEAVNAADGFPMTGVPSTGSGSAPSGGGFIPASSLAGRTEGYGVPLGYCAWDNGSVTNTAGYLPGLNSVANPVFAVISPGADNLTQTTCAQAAAGTAGGDDYVVTMSTAQVYAGGGGAGSMQWGDSVSTFNDLGAISSAALRDGQVRLVRDTNSMFRYDVASATWKSVGGGGVSSDANGNTKGGTDSLKNIDATALRNTALGFEVLMSNVSGSDNAGFGYRALKANTGSQNSAFGSGALVSNTTAGGNSAFGYNAAAANTTGSSITAIGSSALASNQSGVGNTAVGSSAMTAATAGNFSTAVGSRALGSFVAPASGVIAGNTALGAQALFSVVDGVRNTAVGGFSGYYAKGGNNTLIGYAAGYGGRDPFTLDYLFAGSDNIAVGMNSLGGGGTVTKSVAIGNYALVNGYSGTRNIAIGDSALYYAGLGTNAADGNIAIGERASFSNQGGSHAISIGTRSAYNRQTFGATPIYSIAIGTEAMYGGTGNSSTSSIAIGYRSLYGVTSGNRNFAIGDMALQANTTASDNMAFGYEALKANTTGTRNMGFGYQALLSATTANDNSAFGYQALRASTGGTNSAFGASAMAANTTGTGNSAFGYQALAANTTGIGNTSIGDNALRYNTTGGQNTAVGRQALNFNTTGISNIAVGFRSLYNNVSGSDNINIGDSAGFLNSTGGGNVSIGSGAMLNNTSGSNNTAIGSAVFVQAGTGSFNIGMGYGSGYLDLAGSLRASNANVKDASAMTLIGAGSAAVFAANQTARIYATALGAEAIVSSPNTVVLGRADITNNLFDTTVIGSTGSSGAAARLQVTGGLQLVGSAADPIGAAGMLNYRSDTNRYMVVRSTVNSGLQAMAWQDVSGVLGHDSGGNLISSNSGNAQTRSTVSGGSDGITRNVFLGDQAGANQGGSISSWSKDNFAVGYQALSGGASASANTGSRNNAIGNWALLSNTAGYDNNALGYWSLASNTAGYQNSAVGRFSLFANTIGNNNNAIGFSALGQNTNGSGNVAVGALSLGSAPRGSSNTAIGSYSGYGNSAGVAYPKNLNIADASAMTFVGAGSGSNFATDMVGGVYATAIGADAVVSSANTVVLGRPTDSTVIGATGTSGAAARLQVTGGLQLVGATADPTGSAGMVNYRSDTNRYMVFRTTANSGLIANAWQDVTGVLGHDTGGNLISSNSGNTEKRGTAPTDVYPSGIANNIFLGNLAGRYASGSGSGFGSSWSMGNIAIGGEALRGNTGGISIMGYNTAVGHLSMRSIGSAYNNTGVGVATLLQLSAGNENTAIGSGALQATSTGSNNTGVGSGVGSANTTGVSNAFFGYSAGSKNTIGSYNVNIGATAGRSNIAGSVYIDNVKAASAITLIGAGSGAVFASAQTGALYSTALGADAIVTTPGTVVLGRADTTNNLFDTTVIGATGTSGAAARLQVTGGLQLVGSTADPTGSAGMLNYRSDTNRYMVFRTTTNSGLPADAWQDVSGVLGHDSGGNLISSNSGNLQTRATTFDAFGSSTNGIGRNVLLGEGAGQRLGGATGGPGVVPWAVGNFAVGFQALYGSATPSANAGYDNNALGFQTLYANTSGGSNNAMGYAAMMSNTTGSANNAFGYGALAANTSGTGNIAIGYRAMINNTTGSRNIAIGYNAGNASLAGGAYNTNTVGASAVTLLGPGAGTIFASSQSGNLYATAIGADALVSTVNTIVLGRSTDTTVIGETGTSGAAARLQVSGGVQLVGVAGDLVGTNGMLSYNSTTNKFRAYENGMWVDMIGRIGTDSGGNITSGNSGNTQPPATTPGGTDGTSRNILIGDGAGQQLGGSTGTFANNNFAAGYQALYGGGTPSANTGSDNIAIGRQSMFSNTSGSFNAGLGMSALYSNTTGNRNNALGGFALYNNTTGLNNVGVGFNAGYASLGGVGYGGNTAAASALTLIGAGSGASFAAVQSGALYATALGADAVVSTANTVVLGRPADATVIGATGDSGATARLQVTGGLQLVGAAVDPTGANGMIVYNTTANKFRAYQNGAWVDVVSAGGVFAADTGGNLLTTNSGNASTKATTAGGTDGITRNILLGDAAGQRIGGTGTTWASNNFAAGFQALYSSATATANTGSDNIAIGQNSLFANTSGGRNSALGAFALYNNTTGLNNVALGYNAGYATIGGTTQNTNTAQASAVTLLGAGATTNFGAAQSTAIYATAIGADAVVASPNAVVLGRTTDTTVVGSTATSGAQARLQVTGGLQLVGAAGDPTGADGMIVYNTTTNKFRAFQNGAWVDVISTAGSFAADAGGNLLTSNSGNASTKATTAGGTNGITRNILLGDAAGQRIGGTGTTWANNNFAAGFQALYSSATSTANTGSDNIAIGQTALLANTSGSKNVALGGFALNPNTTGSSNVALGYNAGYASVGGTLQNANTVAASTVTLIGAGATTSFGAAQTTAIYATAIGADATVASANTVVLGRATDFTVIGATSAITGDGLLQIGGTARAGITPQVNSTGTGNGVDLGDTNKRFRNIFLSQNPTVTSDIRLKTNIVAFTNEEALDVIRGIPAVRYSWKTDIQGPRQVGTIAQDLYRVLPEAVHVGSDPAQTLGVMYGNLTPVLASALTGVDDRVRKIEKMLETGGLEMANDKWLTSADGKSRLFFDKDGTTRIRGWGDKVLDIRNGDDQSVASLSKNGELDIKGPVTFTGERGGFVFNPTGTLVTSSDPGQIVINSANTLRAAVRLQSTQGSTDPNSGQSVARVWGMLFGDETGVGIADRNGNAILTAKAAQGVKGQAGYIAASVDIDGSLKVGSLTVGNGFTSEINLAAKNALKVVRDGAMQLESEVGVRVYNPASKEVVINLGSDGTVQAKRFRPTEIVNAYDTCKGKTGTIARDASGQLVVCVE